MRRPRRSIFFLITATCIALGLVLLGPGAGGGLPAPRAATPRTPAAPTVAPAEPADGLPTPSRSPCAGLRVAGEDVSIPLRRGRDPTDDALRARLRRVAATRTDDAEAFESVLRPLLAHPKTMARILFLLQERRLAGGRDGGLSAEEVGALRTLAAGLVGGGRAFLIDVLEALVNMAPPVQGILAERLGVTRDAGGRHLLGPELAPELDRLAGRFPDSADLYLELLTAAAGELDDEVAGALDLSEPADERSPTRVNASLAHSLDGADSQTALAWAEALHDDERTDEPLRRAISTAVAGATPVEDAARFLSDRADPDLRVEFDTLGRREGGLEALEDEYYALRVFDDADETARTMLVAGMSRAPAASLLVIAVEDPAARVRGQAWITLARATDFRPTAETFDLLAEGYVDRADPDGGIPTHAVITAAGSLAARPSSPTTRKRAIGLLRTIAEDPEARAEDRHEAIAELENHVSPSEISRLRALLR